MSKNPQQHGILLLNKPKWITSAGCLNRIKCVFGQKKVGHTGTLDPIASGLLVVLLGRATRLASYYTKSDKTYLGELLLGTTTDTYDIEGRITHEQPWEQVAEAHICIAVDAWLKQTVQIVPPYSAAKYKGSPLYKLSREGREVPTKIKPIHIYRVEVIDIALPMIRFRVSCSAGTYIRSLVHSLGIRLGCGAVLTGLTREYSHPFRLNNAYALDAVLSSPEKLQERMLSLDQALPHWPTLIIDQTATRSLRHGAPVDAVGSLAPDKLPIISTAVTQRALAVDKYGRAQCLVELRQQGTKPIWAISRGLW